MAVTLTQLIGTHKPLIVPTVYEGISALLVPNLRFSAASTSSCTTSATEYDLPNIGYIGVKDVADQV